MNDIRMVVFDIAGTTVKDPGNVAACFIEAFRNFDMDIPVAEVKRVMGFRKMDAIRILLDEFYRSNGKTNDMAGMIHKEFTDSMIGFYENDEDLQPLPSVIEVFALLRAKGIKIALNTGFTKAITDTILKKLGWAAGKEYDAVISSDEVESGRPDAGMIHELMKQLQVNDPRKVMKVGDTEVDIEEGRNAGCGLVIGVTSGAYNRKQLEICNPDYIIDNLEELPALIH